MADKRNHTWQEQLQQLPPPDAVKAWGHMEKLLDQHYPVQKPSTHRYLYIALLLLLFILGICNCPTKQQLDPATVSKGESPNSIPHLKTAIKEVPVTTGVLLPQTSTLPGQPTATESGNVVKHSSAQKLPHPFKSLRRRTGTSLKADSRNRPQQVPQSVHQQGLTPKQPSTFGFPLQPDLAALQPASADSLRIGGMIHSTLQDSANTASPKEEQQELVPPLDSVSQNQDTIHRKIQERPLKKQWSLHLGYNKGFAIGRQHYTPVTMEGDFDSWRHLIPVLTVRYSVSKRSFLQAEVQVNAPQYTPRLLLERKVVNSPGPTPTASRRIEQSSYTKKLFYTDIPFILLIKPAPFFAIGGGLQYSRLQEVIGLVEEKSIQPGQPDQLLSRRYQLLTHPLKDPFKTADWRYLVQGFLQWQRFDADVRFSHALLPVVKESSTNNALLTWRNTSLQVTARYKILEREKK